MFSRILSLTVVALMGVVLALYEMGSIAPGDALFIAAAIVFVFTGQQLIARETMGIGQAATSMFTSPTSFRSRTAFASYFACLALGALVTAQVFLLT